MENNVISSSVQRNDRSELSKTILRFASSYDIIPEWWSPDRDAFFRNYWPQENFLASAIYSIVNRNAAFGWGLTGTEEDVQLAQNMLQFAEFGDGWQQFITKFSIDYLTQDNGAFIEVIRPARAKIDGKYYKAYKQYYENDIAEWYADINGKLTPLRNKEYTILDTPLDLPIGIAHLDAGRCQRNDDPDVPIIYTDTFGKRHKLKWWQVLCFNEMPSPIKDMNGVGYSALSRVFRASHIMQSISLYNDEKVSGRFNRAIILTNASAEMINDAIKTSNDDNNNSGLLRYSQPIVVDTVKPDVAPSVSVIPLAEVPDGFNIDTMNNWYIANLALALGVDYGFLAPLPGKGLGTASQSETMAKQTKGKSSRLFMDSVSNALNFKGVLPKTVQFNFVEKDTEEENRIEQQRKQRADRFKLYIDSGIIPATIARQMAADEGDIDSTYIDALGEDDITPIVTTDGDESVETQQEMSDAIEEEDVEEENETSLFEDNIEASAERGKQLFKEKSIAESVKRLVKNAFSKKQIAVPEQVSGKLKTSLQRYGDDLEKLAVQAMDNEINKDEYIAGMESLVYPTLIAIFSEYSGKSQDEFSKQDEANLDEYLARNYDSIKRIADDIYNGRYEETEEEPDRPLMLFVRLSLWLANASALSNLAKLRGKDNRDKKLMWVMGIAEHCDTCLALDGQVHTVEEWDYAGFYPGNEELLLCNGFNCKCNFEPVDDKTDTWGDLERVPTK